MTEGLSQVSGMIVTPEGVLRGHLRFDSLIREIGADADATERWVLPGFIDLHVHGGGGADTMDGAHGIRALARFHARHGTTSLLPTTLTAPWPDVIGALQGVGAVMGEGGPAPADAPLGADVLGAHLEGPFISGLRLGAQPAYDRDPEPDLLGEALALGVVRVVTMAPERAGALEAAVRFAEAGVRVSVGHTAATYEEVRAFAAAVRDHGGTLGFTHLFNAMGGMQGRVPGVVGAALSDPLAFAELILDGQHVHAGSALAAYRALGPRLLLVSDAIAATGTDVRSALLGDRPIIIEQRVARTAEGALAGSMLTLDEALRRAHGTGIAVADASRMLSEGPAAFLGITDRGTVAVGRRADLVVLGADLRVEAVYLAGRRARA